jgi:ParB/RepB/Spo0J family partition protein
MPNQENPNFENPAASPLETPEFFVQNPETERLLAQFSREIERKSQNKFGVLVQIKHGLAATKIADIIEAFTSAGAQRANHGTTLIYLFPETQKNPEKLANISLADLVPGPNPRMHIEIPTIEDLLKDIKENRLKERIKVRPSQEVLGKFQVIDGNRRVEVYKLLKKQEIPAVIVEMNDEEAYVAAFVINNDREPLTQFERGRWYKILMERFPEKFPSQRALAPYVAVNHATISLDITYYERYAPQNQHGYQATMKKTESPREEAANAEEVETENQPQTEIPCERVDREIRQFPLEIQKDLCSQAVNEKLTAEQTKERGETLTIIGKVPEQYRNKLLEETLIHCLNKDQVEKIANELIVKMPSDEEAERLWLAAGKKEMRQEEAGKRAFLKNAVVVTDKRKLTDFYAEEVLKIIVDHFGRQQKAEMTMQLTRKFTKYATQALTPEQIENILKRISKEG